MSVIKFSFQNILCCFSLLVLLAACAPTGRYQQHKDSVPSRTPSEAELKDAIPRAEALSRGGNKHYTVRGKNYLVLPNAIKFKEKGIASFYGEKFHGHLTSNGEIYNMYAMTAAHKNLPLPTYVKVKNLENNRTTIVRVNDRGPFHPGRIIDLSYSAAYKLGITGTAQVEIEAITDFTPPVEDPNPAVVITTPITPVTPLSTTPQPAEFTEPTPVQAQAQANKAIKQPYIQVFATQNPTMAKSLIASLTHKYKTPVISQPSNGLYRIIMGPFKNPSERFLMLQQLKGAGYENAFGKEMFQP